MIYFDFAADIGPNVIVTTVLGSYLTILAYSIIRKYTKGK